MWIGAGGRIRTADPRITNALLYQLSYTGISLEAAYYLACEPALPSGGRALPCRVVATSRQYLSDRIPAPPRLCYVPGDRGKPGEQNQ
jgi:hypothetical protein